jgi:ketosteroid isomerase-like protein
MLDAFNEGDTAGVVAAFDADCVVLEPPEMPDTPTDGYRGHDGIRRWFSNLRDTGGIRFETVGARADGDVVVSELIGRGAGQGSGAPFEWTTFIVSVVRDGRIARVQAFLGREDALSAARELRRT